MARIIGFRLVTQQAERLSRFYAALGFEVADERPIEPDELSLLEATGSGRRRSLHLGMAHVDLDAFEHPGQAYPAGTDAASACFQHLAIVTDDIGAAWVRARAAGASPISRDGPVTLPPATGSVTAIKFRDPEGHPLELLQFPDASAKGWAGTGMLGIDHSALVVTDLAASRTFYAGLGLSGGDVTLNHGATQAALDGLAHPLVDVVPMNPRHRPPHVELLHYRSPTRRSGPSWAPKDVAATKVVWQGDEPALLRDPDGHFHQVDR